MGRERFPALDHDGATTLDPQGRPGDLGGTSADRRTDRQSRSVHSDESARRHADAGDPSDPLSGLSTVPLGGLLEVLTLLHVLRQSFLFAELLESTEHLLRTLATTGLDSNRHDLRCSRPRKAVFLGEAKHYNQSPASPQGATRPDAGLRWTFEAEFRPPACRIPAGTAHLLP
jgi:hypothetical protein